MAAVSPDQTFAIVVGVEHYEVGEKWNLDGPAPDARRFAAWLLDRGVPADHIALCLAPLSSNKDAMGLPETVAAQEATYGRFDKLLTDELPNRNESLLIVYWGGHGLMQPDGTQHLFTADATVANKRNIPLSRVMQYLRSSAIPDTAFNQQVLIVDACANYVQSRKLLTAIPAVDFPYGSDVVVNRQQFTLFAARPGEAAKNLDKLQTGLFSRELRTLLEAQPAAVWPPDFDSVATALMQRFAALRNQGLPGQTPGFFSAGPWGGAVRTLGAVPTTGSADPASVTLSAQDKGRLADALLECDSILLRDTREDVLRQLRRRMRNAIPRHNANKFDVFSIVDTCLRYSGGLAELIRTVRVQDAESDGMKNVDTLLKEILPAVYEESL